MYGLNSRKALNIVPFLVTVHFKEEFREDVKEGIQRSKFQVKILTDDQAILIQDGKTSLIGKGKEIIL